MGALFRFLLLLPASTLTAAAAPDRWLVVVVIPVDRWVADGR